MKKKMLKGFYKSKNRLSYWHLRQVKFKILNLHTTCNEHIKIDETSFKPIYATYEMYNSGKFS